MPEEAGVMRKQPSPRGRVAIRGQYDDNMMYGANPEAYQPRPTSYCAQERAQVQSVVGRCLVQFGA